MFLQSDLDLNQANFGLNSFYVKCTNNATGAVYYNTGDVTIYHVLISGMTYILGREEEELATK